MIEKAHRIIKKYPNRRLYDTDISTYVTLSELRQLVMTGIDFRVVDAKSEQDITHSVLLQIITEQEHSSQPMFSNQFLAQLIRLYGDSTQGLYSDFLQSSMSLFMQQQKQLEERFNASTNPFQALSSMTDHSLKMWHQVQESMKGQKSYEEPQSPPSAPSPKPKDEE